MLGIPHDKLVGLCESHFSAIPAGNVAANEKPNYTGGRLWCTEQYLYRFTIMKIVQKAAEKLHIFSNFLGEVHCEQSYGLVHVALASEGAR
jgi:hypothetical protein